MSSASQRVISLRKAWMMAAIGVVAGIVLVLTATTIRQAMNNGPIYDDANGVTVPVLDDINNVRIPVHNGKGNFYYGPNGVPSKNGATDGAFPRMGSAPDLPVNKFVNGMTYQVYCYVAANGTSVRQKNLGVIAVLQEPNGEWVYTNHPEIMRLDDNTYIKVSRDNADWKFEVVDTSKVSFKLSDYTSFYFPYP